MFRIKCRSDSCEIRDRRKVNCVRKNLRLQHSSKKVSARSQGSPQAKISQEKEFISPDNSLKIPPYLKYHWLRAAHMKWCRLGGD